MCAEIIQRYRSLRSSKAMNDKWAYMQRARILQGFYLFCQTTDGATKYEVNLIGADHEGAHRSLAISPEGMLIKDTTDAIQTWTGNLPGGDTLYYVVVRCIWAENQFLDVSYELVTTGNYDPATDVICGTVLMQVAAIEWWAHSAIEMDYCADIGADPSAYQKNSIPLDNVHAQEGLWQKQDIVGSPIEMPADSTSDYWLGKWTLPFGGRDWIDLSEELADLPSGESQVIQWPCKISVYGWLGGPSAPGADTVVLGWHIKTYEDSGQGEQVVYPMQYNDAYLKVFDDTKYTQAGPAKILEIPLTFDWDLRDSNPPFFSPDAFMNMLFWRIGNTGQDTFAHDIGVWVARFEYALWKPGLRLQTIV